MYMYMYMYMYIYMFIVMVLLQLIIPRVVSSQPSKFLILYEKSPRPRRGRRDREPLATISRVMKHTYVSCRAN